MNYLPDLTDPFVLSYHVLLFVLSPALLGAYMGKSKDGDLDKVSSYRSAGIELGVVLFPFFIYIIINAFHGKIDQVLLSPELPMASLIICSLTLLLIPKVRNATNGNIRDEVFTIIKVVVISMFVADLCLIYYLTTSDNVSDWFSLLNSLLIVVSTMVGYGFIASMTYITQYPEKFILEADDKKSSQ